MATVRLASRVTRVKPSPTLAVTQRALELQAQGQDIISLGAGEPDFDTPDPIKEAAIRAIQEGKTKYTAVDGIPPLKEAIVHKFRKENGLDYTPKQIIVSTGAKQSIYNLLQVLIQPNDEVLIPAPYWVSYPDMVYLAEGTPVILPTTLEQRFKITPEQLEQAITPHTRLLFLNSPSNPTGIAYTKEELKGLAEVLLRHPHVWIATDDIYEHILWTEAPFMNILMACSELYDRTVIINGVSKAYAMTGWRIGYASGPLPVIQAMNVIQSQSTSNPTTVAQYAALAALTGSLSETQKMVATFKTRHDYLVTQLNQLEGISCLKGDGTFYAFPCVQGLLERFPFGDSDPQLCDYLLTQAEVALVPGTAFGQPGFMRLSFATSLENLEKAVFRLQRALSSLDLVGEKQIG